MDYRTSDIAIIAVNLSLRERRRRLLPDPQAAEVGCVRVIDASGEDYLYPTTCCIQVTFPEDVRERLLATVGKTQA